MVELLSGSSLAILQFHLAGLKTLTCATSAVVQENPSPSFSTKRKENYSEGVGWFLFTSVDGVMEKRNNKNKKKLK